jgi:hypothetical protein
MRELTFPIVFLALAMSAYAVVTARKAATSAAGATTTAIHAATSPSAARRTVMWWQCQNGGPRVPLGARCP